MIAPVDSIFSLLCDTTAATIRHIEVTDTAGIRDTEDVIESIGTKRALSAAENADLILFMIDGSEYLTTEIMQIFSAVYKKKLIIILNKADKTLMVRPDDVYNHLKESAEKEISALTKEEFFDRYPCIIMSASGGQGLEDLKRTVRAGFLSGDITSKSDVVITGLRHKELLADALESLKGVKEGIASGVEIDVYCGDLYNAYKKLGLIIGEELGDDLADEIFSKFCMGK